MAAAVPFFASDIQLFRLTGVLIYAIALLGLNLLVGYNGQISLGHGAFYGVGAYTVAILVAHFAVPHWAALPAVAAVCLVTGFLFGFAVRLPTVHLAIATLALGAALPSLVKHKALEPWTGGTPGMALERLEVPFGLALSFDQWLYFLTLGALAVLLALAANLVRGRIGRAIVALRDHPLAAQAMGIPAAPYRSIVFALSAMVTGIAGALSALSIQYVAPGIYGVLLSFSFIVGIAVGGVATLSGALYGAAFLQLIHLAVGDVHAIYGAALIFVLYSMPGGIAGALHHFTRR